MPIVQFENEQVNLVNYPVTTAPQDLAFVSIDNVEPGDEVWLNVGIGGLTNNNPATFARVELKIYKGIATPMNQIYQTVQEVDQSNDGSIVNVALSHVDTIEDAATVVNYLVTISLLHPSNNVVINGPITFTAANIRP